MPRILIIDDDQTFRRALRIALEKSGFEVLEAGDGHAGLAAFKTHTVDLVVTDLIMPDMEGIETIQNLRKLSPHLLIIAITGGGRGTPDNYLHFAAKFGAALTFAKPFELNTLCAAIGSLLVGNGVKPTPPPSGEDNGSVS